MISSTSGLFDGICATQRLHLTEPKNISIFNRTYDFEYEFPYVDLPSGSIGQAYIYICGLEFQVSAHIYGDGFGDIYVLFRWFVVTTNASANYQITDYTHQSKNFSLGIYAGVNGTETLVPYAWHAYKNTTDRFTPLPTGCTNKQQGNFDCICYPMVGTASGNYFNGTDVLLLYGFRCEYSTGGYYQSYILFYPEGVSHKKFPSASQTKAYYPRFYNHGVDNYPIYVGTGVPERTYYRPNVTKTQRNSSLTFSNLTLPDNRCSTRFPSNFWICGGVYKHNNVGFDLHQIKYDTGCNQSYCSTYYTTHYHALKIQTPRQALYKGFTQECHVDCVSGRCCSHGCSVTTIDGSHYNGDNCTTSCSMICGASGSKSICVQCPVQSNQLPFWAFFVIIFGLFLFFMFLFFFKWSWFKFECGNKRLSTRYMWRGTSHQTFNIFLILLLFILSCGVIRPTLSINIGPNEWNLGFHNGSNTFIVHSAYTNFSCVHLKTYCDRWCSRGANFLYCNSDEKDNECETSGHQLHTTSWHQSLHWFGWSFGCLSADVLAVGCCFTTCCGNLYDTYECSSYHHDEFNIEYRTNISFVGTLNHTGTTQLPNGLITISGCSGNYHSAQFTFKRGDPLVPRDPNGCCAVGPTGSECPTVGNIIPENGYATTECTPPRSCNPQYVGVTGVFRFNYNLSFSVPQTCDYSFNYWVDYCHDNCTWDIIKCGSFGSGTICVVHVNKTCCNNNRVLYPTDYHDESCDDCCYRGKCYSGPRDDWNPAPMSNIDYGSLDGDDFYKFWDWFKSLFNGPFSWLVYIVLIVILICFIPSLIGCIVRK